MKILYVIPYVPNLIRVRPYNLIRHVAAAGHEVTVATLWSGERERADLAALDQLVERVISFPLPRWRSAVNSLLALPSGRPLQEGYCWEPALVDALDNLFIPGEPSPFDAIHVEHLRGVRYALFLQQLLQERYGARRPPLVWDSVDCISFLFRQAAQQSKSRFGRWMTRFELKRTAAYEAWLATQFDRILVTSPHDRQAYLDLLDAEREDGAADRLHVLPNGVDLTYFRPNPAVARKPATLVVSGKMSYHANVTMVLDLVGEIMPLVWAARPDVHLEIVGKDPARAIQALAEDPRITVTGTVPEIRPYLQAATIAVAPIAYGAGIQNKVLEAMACGTPVVASSPAVSALTATNGVHLLAEPDPAGIARAVLRLLEDPQLRREISENGLHYVEDRHNWTNIAGRLTELYTAAHQKQPPVMSRFH